MSYKSPRLKYVPSKGMFSLKGFMEKDGILIPLTEAFVSSDEVKSRHQLTESGLQGYFPDYKPKAKGGKAKKDSFPIWMSKNPNGTAAQFKQYLSN